MVQSIFDVFKISLGPSSSHTTGPMLAARDFALRLEQNLQLENVSKIEITLFGSLAATGLGHSTDKALILGLMGYSPETIDPYQIRKLLGEQSDTKKLNLLSKKQIPFIRQEHIIFKACTSLDFHPNAMNIEAFCREKTLILQDLYYSVGGGKIIAESKNEASLEEKKHRKEAPFSFSSSKEMQELCKENKLSISELTLQNELTFRSLKEIQEGLFKIMSTMEKCIEKGCHETGFLPGYLKVKRRARSLYMKLQEREKKFKIEDPTHVLDWVNLYALSVNEENASGSKIITAPTNGAAGIVPAVLKYYSQHTKTPSIKGSHDFLLTAGAVGTLYMKKASISGAEVGCQGEVGVACSMAAAGLTAALGGTNIQIEKAAEIGMEHNLGLTCDPIGGLVQIPCIERNAMGSIKAINASRLACISDELGHISLDDVIKTMYQTGLDMKSSYKETSMGGLAVNVTNC